MQPSEIIRPPGKKDAHRNDDHEPPSHERILAVAQWRRQAPYRAHMRIAPPPVFDDSDSLSLLGLMSSQWRIQGRDQLGQREYLARCDGVCC